MSEQAKALVEKIAAVARRSAAREGIDVWDIEVLGGGRHRVVRIYIDKPAGVTHGDCELISDQVGTVLDVEEVISGPYQLEVSSPGIERRLRTADHYRLSAGKRAKVMLREPLENQRRWEGTLGYEEGAVTLETAPGHFLRFRPEQVEKAQLKFDW